MEQDDRETALLLFEKIIDSAADENLVLSKLVSPTRQAVNIARAYDVAERRASIERGDMDTPKFVEVIMNVGRDALEGISIFDDMPRAVIVDEEDYPVEEGPAEDVVDEEMKAKIAAAVADIASAVNLDETPAPVDMSEIIEKNRDIYEEDEPAAELPEKKADEPSALDDFVANIDVFDEISAAELTAGIEETVDAVPDENEIKSEETEELKAVPDAAEEIKEEKADKPSQGKKRVKAGLLILYILFAVPICALAVLLILTVAVALLLGAFAIGKIAVLGIGSAFGGYAIFADILAVIGVSLVILALAILFAWTAVWLVCGVTVSLIRGAIRLAGKWCCEEVEG